MAVEFSKAASRRDASHTWLDDLLAGLNTGVDQTLRVTMHASKSSQCVLCKGSRNLCGKIRCPIMVKVNFFCEVCR